MFRMSNYVRINDNHTYGLGQTIEGVFGFDIPTSMATAELNVIIGRAEYFSDNDYSSEDGLAQLYKIELLPSAGDLEFISEKHTVTNDGNYTSIPDTIEVLNGEGEFEAYLGTMLKSDGTNTDGFYRDGSIDKIPFLTLAAEDILYQHGRPMNKYEGSIYGVFLFLSKITINNGLSGVFMTSALRYDFRNNITSATLIEMSSEPVESTVLVNYEYKAIEEKGVDGST